MSEEFNNHFILKKIFPEAKSILKIQTKKIEEVFKDAIFVLDTNTLLAPFQAGKDGIDKIGKIYSKLVSDKRVFIPEHALREFAKNRSIKISELFTNIDNLMSSIPTVKSVEYPILSQISTYKTLQEKRDNILKELKSYKALLTELKNGIVDWNWSDPVSAMYSITFSEDSIIDISLKEEDLINEYNERLKNEMPPGNKDKSKETNAIGDFLIWKSILKLGKEKQKDIIFVSNDEKNDWLLKGNQKSIYTKFELVNEFFNETNGKNFISINFAKFLELQGVEIELSDVNTSIINDNISNELRAGTTLDSLKKIYRYIHVYLNDYDDSEDLYIEDEINIQIKDFLKSYKHEFFDTPQWQSYSHYLIRFSDLLSRIESLNNEIIYQAYRQKRSTFTHQLEMKALCAKFIELYGEFNQIR